MSLSGGVQIFANDVFDTTTTAVHDIGLLGMSLDGRCSRYSQAGGSNIAAGKLNVAATQVADDENIACAATAVGTVQVTVTLGASAVVANQYANGYFIVNDVDGEGQTIQISGHPAASGAATLVVTLKEPLQVALTTSSQASLVKNMWDDVVISATDQADFAVGIPNVAIATTAFGWLQTKGICAALADENVAAGIELTIGTGVAGAVEAYDAAGEQTIGVTHTALIDTEYRSVYLSID